MSRTILTVRRVFGGPPPVNTVSPTISGSLTTGSTLTCTTGTWTGSPSLTYQWLRNYVPISGATASTRNITAEDAGRMITCVVTGTNAFGSADAYSNDLVTNVYAVAQLTTTATYSAPGTTPNLPAGSVSMAMGVAWRKITPNATSMANQNLIHRYSSGVSGFRLTMLDGNGTTGRVRQISYATSSAPAQVFTSNLQTIAYTPTQNLLQRSVYSLMGGTLYTYRNGALIASIGCTGYTTPNNLIPFVIGTISGSTDEFELVSVSISDTHGMDAGEVSAWDAQVIGHGSRRIPDATHEWEAADAGATWVDRILGVSLTRNNSPSVRNYTPTYE
jgi:hypothetical protein